MSPLAGALRVPGVLAEISGAVDKPEAGPTQRRRVGMESGSRFSLSGKFLSLYISGTREPRMLGPGWLSCWYLAACLVRS